MANLGWTVVALLWIVMAGGAMPPAMAAESSPSAAAGGLQQRVLNSMQALDYAVLPGGEIVIRAVFEHELSERPAVMVHYHPAARIVFDFANSVSAVGKEPVEVRQRGVHSLHVVQTGTRTRLVINLGRTFVQESTLKGKELLITLRRPETMGPADTKRWSADTASGAPRHELREVVFERGATREGRIIVEQSDAAIPIDIRQEGKALIVDFHDSALPPQLARRLDVRDFGTAIQAIETYRVGNHVRMKIELEGAAAYSAYQVSRQFIVSPQ